MNARRAPKVTPAVALFDLDGTLTWRDTLLPFLAGYALRHPTRLLRLWRLLPARLEYAARGRDRGRLKSRAIRAVMGGDRRAHDRCLGRSRSYSRSSRVGRFRAAALATLEAHRAGGRSSGAVIGKPGSVCAARRPAAAASSGRYAPKFCGEATGSTAP